MDIGVNFAVQGKDPLPDWSYGAQVVVHARADVEDRRESERDVARTFFHPRYNVSIEKTVKEEVCDATWT